MMNAIRALAVLAMVLHAGVAVAQADGDPAGRRAVAADLAELVLGDQIFSQIIPTMSSQLEAGLRNNPKITEAEAKLFSQRLAEVMAERMNVDIKPISVDLMTESFTITEMRAMIAFYSSPEGRSVQAKLPVYLNRVMEVVMPYARSVAPELIDKVAAELELTEKLQ